MGSLVLSSRSGLRSENQGWHPVASEARIDVTMNKGCWTIRMASLLAYAIVCLAQAPEVLGQARSGVTIRSPGSLRRPGGSGIRSFRTNSYGLGGLQSSGTAGPLRSSISGGLGTALRSSMGTAGIGSSLRSNIDTSSAFGTPRDTGISGTSGGVAAGFGPRSVSVTGSPGFSMGSHGGTGVSRSLLGLDTDFAAARAFVQSVGDADSGLVKSAEPITSLVPDQPGRYRDHLADGEERFRAGDFIVAFDKFRLANDIVGRSPETLLSMAHAKFATARFSYASAAFYLRKALKYLPELPLVPLRPKAFYGNPATFGEHIIRLQEHLDEHRFDGDALLLLAYFRWFIDRPDVETIQVALSKALAASRDDEVAEAVRTFWDGMVATGKVSGELFPATRPAPKTNPSDVTPISPGSTNDRVISPGTP